MECKISVIIPVYNVRNKIYKCLESLKKQTFKDFEVLFVDDGSKDDSIYLARDYMKYTDVNFRILKKKNGGVSSARNLGIDEAKGEYICFLDSDDYIESDLLSDFYETARNSESDIVYCGYIYEDNDGNKISSNLSNLKKGDYSGKDATLGLIYGYSHTSIISNLFRRKLINDNNIRFDENRKYAEDTAFEIKAYAHADKVSCLRKLSTHYIKWEESATNSTNKNYLDVYYSNIETLNYLKEEFNDKDLEKAMIEYRIPVSIINIFSEFAGKSLFKHILLSFINESATKEYLKKIKVHKLKKDRIKYYIMGKTILYMPWCLELYYKKLKLKR